MKKERTLFQLYAGHDRASALSVAGGAFRLLSLLLIAAAALYTMALLLSGFRVTLAGGLGTAFLFLMDELDDELLAAFFLWGLVIACRYTACVLQAKARLLVQPVPPAQQTPPAPPAPQEAVEPPLL